MCKRKIGTEYTQRRHLVKFYEKKTYRQMNLLRKKVCSKIRHIVSYKSILSRAVAWIVLVQSTFWLVIKTVKIPFNETFYLTKNFLEPL